MATTPSTMEKQPLLPHNSNPNATRTGSEEQQELHALRTQLHSAQRAYIRAWSRSTSGKWHRRIMAGVTAFLCIFMVFCLAVIANDWANDDGDDWVTRKKVPLEAHIMSKCPDARDCLRDLVLPTMQKVEGKVDFRLSFIGSTTDHDDGVSCMHGPTECLGNILELCAQHLYPDPKIYLGFTMCLSRDYQHIPERELVEDCALEHGVDMYKINKCAADDEGSLAHEMLKTSFNRSAEAGVTKSCTVRLDGEVRCIRDGGEWTDCEGGHRVKDLVGDILDLAGDDSDD